MQRGVRAQGVLREPRFPLSRVADKTKDVMIKARRACCMLRLGSLLCIEREILIEQVVKLILILSLNSLAANNSCMRA
jgi:hypothetical protein